METEVHIGTIHLNPDVILEILSSTDSQSLRALCSVNISINSVCNQPELWRRKLKKLGATQARLNGLSVTALYNLYNKLTNVGYSVTAYDCSDTEYEHYLLSGVSDLYNFTIHPGYNLLTGDGYNLIRGNKLYSATDTTGLLRKVKVKTDSLLHGKIPMGDEELKETYSAYIVYADASSVLTLDGQLYLELINDNGTYQFRSVATNIREALVFHYDSSGLDKLLLSNNDGKIVEYNIGNDMLSVLEDVLYAGIVGPWTVFMDTSGMLYPDEVYNINNDRSQFPYWELSSFPGTPSLITAGHITGADEEIIIVDSNDDLYFCNVVGDQAGEWQYGIGNVKRVVNQVFQDEADRPFTLILTHNGELYNNLDFIASGVIDINFCDIILDISHFPSIRDKQEELKREVVMLNNLYQLQQLD